MPAPILFAAFCAVAALTGHAHNVWVGIANPDPLRDSRKIFTLKLSKGDNAMTD